MGCPCAPMGYLQTGGELNKETPTPMNYKTLIAASLMSIALTSAAFAQCTDCALFPDRDPLNNGAETPASKMGLTTSGAPRTNNAHSANNNAHSANGVNNARAEARGHHLRRSSHKSGVDGNLAK
jgi:hypothetical protein